MRTTPDIYRIYKKEGRNGEITRAITICDMQCGGFGQVGISITCSDLVCAQMVLEALGGNEAVDHYRDFFEAHSFSY